MIANNEAIWAYGATADEARAMFASEMAEAGIS